ncbi:Lrp/AsnC family transcriptional regulator [Herbaspirillum sp. alder98]|uniref:Lrp/AsnC family transcriptional regulator n=1 Tax=Herbaspirillum sp. alder98 TaxID=2913096 RepID=UPI001CD89786|nr:Lrp/AsnC family transcriptional regulator [Herbaspirillum sp. alder98]MCA1326723.1 Lrp/AsnC family transcriptional regulator [Herbaspirillum sp. alder98]
MSLDDTDRQLLGLLQVDARMPIKTLAEHIGLSAPGTADRLRRLEERGIIRAYTIEVDPHALGYSLQAIVRIKPLPGKLSAVMKVLETIPELSECDKVTGDDCFIARLHLRSIEHLDFILARIVDKAETNSAIVKSQPVTRRLPAF